MAGCLSATTASTTPCGTRKWAPARLCYRSVRDPLEAALQPCRCATFLQHDPTHADHCRTSRAHVLHIQKNDGSLSSLPAADMLAESPAGGVQPGQPDGAVPGHRLAGPGLLVLQCQVRRTKLSETWDRVTGCLVPPPSLVVLEQGCSPC